MQEHYGRTFHHVKQDKHIKFFNMLGSVTMSIETQGRVLDIEASPLQATVIDAFTKRTRYTWEDMAERIGITDQKIVEHALNFWVNEGVLQREEDGAYSLVEAADAEPVDVDTTVLRT